MQRMMLANERMATDGRGGPLVSPVDQSTMTQLQSELITVPNFRTHTGEVLEPTERHMERKREVKGRSEAT